MDTPLAVSFFQPFFPQKSWRGSIPPASFSPGYDVDISTLRQTSGLITLDDGYGNTGGRNPQKSFTVKDSLGFFVLLGEMKYELQAIWVKKAVQNLHISCGFSSDPKKTFRWMKDSTKSGRKHIQKMKSQTTTNQFQGVMHSLGQNNGGSYVVDTNIIRTSASAYYEPQVGLLTEAPLKVRNQAQRRQYKKEIVI